MGGLFFYRINTEAIRIRVTFFSNYIFLEKHNKSAIQRYTRARTRAKEKKKTSSKSLTIQNKKLFLQ